MSLAMAIKRAYYASHAEEKTEALSDFILSTARMAKDLKMLCEARKNGNRSQRLTEVITIYEQEILTEFADKFGENLFKEAQ